TRPDIRLEAIAWHSTVPPSQVAAPGAAPGTTPPPLHEQTAELAGQLAPFDGDYRAAIERVDDFAAALAARAGVRAVEVLHYPLDVRSDASVSGSATAPRDRLVAYFKVRVTLEVGDGTQEG